MPVDGSSFCEWTGQARYLDVRAGDECRARAARSYPDPTAPFSIPRSHVACYVGAMDADIVDSEGVVARPDGFYGGWITSAVAGPFKDVPGSRY